MSEADVSEDGERFLPDQVPQQFIPARAVGSPMRVGIIGVAYGCGNDELTLRVPRSLLEMEMRGNPDAYSWEPNIPKSTPKRFRWGPPMFNAPSGAMAELQRVLLKKPQAPALGTAFRLAWSVLKRPISFSAHSKD